MMMRSTVSPSRRSMRYEVKEALAGGGEVQDEF
jgi:hypothetical protein